jgi:hypothetical protein
VLDKQEGEMYLSSFNKTVFKHPKSFLTQFHRQLKRAVMPLKYVTSYYNFPNILLFSVGGHKISATKCIKIRTDSGPKRLHLKGLVYHGAFHFTCCIVTNDGSVWFHDGQLGSNCQYEKKLK